MNIDFDVTRLWETLPYMASGMLGIFLVTGAIILTVYVLNRLTSGKGN